MDKRHYSLIIIFLVIFGISLSFSLKKNNFSDDISYLNLRQIENIKEKGVPIYHDELSYSGREHIFLPLFHYLIAFASLFIPLGLAVKIIPSLFMALSSVVVYSISLSLTRNVLASNLAALTSGFVPVLFSTTATSLSSLSLSILLILLCLYFFINLSQKSSVYFLLIFFTFLLLNTALSLVFVIVLVFYILMLRLDNLKIEENEAEISVFLLFLTSWFLFIIFKKAILLHGVSVILQNVPSFLSGSYFEEINILIAITQIGAIPFLFGLYTIYRYTFQPKNKPITLLISFSLVTFLFLWFNIIQAEIGLSILGMVMVIMLSTYFKDFFVYLDKFKFRNFKTLSLFLILIIIAGTSVYPAIFFTTQRIKNSTSDELFNALIWIKNNTENSSVVLAHYSLGNLISYISERKNVADTDFLLISNAEEVLEDVKSIYSSRYATQAVRLIEKYSVDYIILSDLEKKYYDTPDYFSSDCFVLVYDKKVKIFKPTCKLETY